MTTRTINLSRKVLMTILVLALIGDILLWLMFHATAHRIPISTEVSFATMTLILIVSIYGTRKYVRSKSEIKD